MRVLDIAIVLIWREGRVLVQRRLPDADHLPGLWEFPGGKCEAGETPRDCAIREAREELGVGIGITGERDAIKHDYATRIVTLHPFDAVIEQGEPQALAACEMRWLAPKEMLPDEFPPANAALLADL